MLSPPPGAVIPAAAATPAGASAATGDASTPPLVFVPGYKGSTLATGDGTVGWLSAWEALGFSTPSLALPTRWAAGVQARDAFSATGVLMALRLVPGLVRLDFYGPFLGAAAADFHAPLHPFAYDWRRDNDESTEALLRFIEPLAAAAPGGKVDVVAHSMGGLLALAALHTRPQLFRKIVFAGTPFRGGVSMLQDLTVEMAVGRNEALLSPEVVATFASVFSLFPSSGDFLQGAGGEAIAADFFRPKDWERLALGPFARGAPTAEYRTFFAEALERAEGFRTRLAARPMTYPPILVVASRARPTFRRAVRGGPKAVHGWDFETAPREDGDGRVAYGAAQPPEGIPSESIPSDREHAELLSDPNVIEKVRHFLYGAR
jgi:pimeloyl-ACP methyl ester carboxylesterase